MLLRTFWPALSILLVFLVFFSVLMTMVTRNNAEMRRENQHTRMLRAAEELESALTQIDLEQREIINSKSFSQLVYMYDDLDWYTRYVLQSELRDSLRALNDRYDYVSGTELYIPSLSRSISNARTFAGYHSDSAGIGDLEDGINLLATGEAVNAAIRRDDVQPLATLIVRLNDEEICQWLSYYCVDEHDRLKVLWDGEMDAEASPRATFAVDGVRLPFRLCYFGGENTTDVYATRVMALSIAFVALGLIVSAVGLFFWYRSVYVPLHHLLVEAFDRMEAGDLTYRISIEDRSPFRDIFRSYNNMMDRMEHYVDSELRQKILVSRANLKQLQSQINPHFMYNSYYILYRLIKRGDKESSLQMAEHLGQFFQYITRNADDEKRLQEEVEHARTYAAIQKFRFRDQLEVQIDTPDPRIARVYVPRLILQPLLENAFKYAYDVETADAMLLRVRYDVRDSRDFDILVENSGNIDESAVDAIREKLQCRDEEIETTALVNIHRRLKIYYGDESELRVSRSELGGLCVCMHIEDLREDV